MRIFARRAVDQTLDPAKSKIALVAELVHADVPAGELIDLCTASFLRDNLVVEERPVDLEVVPIRIDLSPEILPVVKRGDFYKILGRRVLRSKLSDSVSEALDDVRFLRAEDQNTKNLILVPCMEVMRFFYGTSSRLIRSILSGDVQDPHREIYSPSRTKLPDKDGRMEIMLRKGMLLDDAPVIASWLTHGLHGLSEAQRIAKHLAVQKARGDAFNFVSAAPPFRGILDLEALAYRTHDEAGEVLLISRIFSCSADPGFSSLSYFREGESGIARTGDEDKGGLQQGGHAKPQRFAESEPLDFVYLDPGERPSSQNITHLITSEDLLARFPKMAEASMIHVKQSAEELRDQRIGARLQERSAQELTTRVPHGKGSEIRRNVDISSGLAPGGATGADSMSAADALGHVLDICEAMQSDLHAVWNDRAETAQKATFRGRVFNLPGGSESGSHKSRYRYLDSQRTKLRPIYVGEIRIGGRYGYILEIVRSAGVACSTLLLNSANNAQLSDKAICDIVEECAAHASVILPNYLLEKWSITAARFPHIKARPVQRAHDAALILGLA